MSSGDVKCRPPTFQLELMRHDPVMRESFQKLSDWLCKDLPELLTDLRTTITINDSPPTLVRDCVCDASVYPGAVVRNNNGICVNALATTEANSRALGIVISKSSSTSCLVVLNGRTGDVFTGLNQDKDYYLSPTVPGGIQVVIPNGSGHFISLIGRSLSTKSLDVNIGLRMQRA